MPDPNPANSQHSNLPYRGRFAPSPTGPLHFGSLIAAVASFLDARINNGAWLLRMDDLDPPREIPGAAQGILHSLQQHGLQWDEEVLWQSERSSAYQQALAQLEPLTFRCDCSRTKLGPNGICQSNCRSQSTPITTAAATRIAVPAELSIVFNDRIQGHQSEPLGLTSENFLIHRKDGLYAYQLAVVVDDAYQGITHVVRGSDLLDTTARQHFLQQVLGHSTPHYCHIPVITNARGQKFSKQNHAPALIDPEAPQNLRAALQFLQQSAPPPHMKCTETILNFACHNWQPKLIPTVMSITSR